MKLSAITALAVAQVASAHYFFDTNIIGGTQQPQFKYVRKSTRAVAYNPIKFSSNPAADIRDNSHVDSADIICNQGANKNGASTQTLEVKAGSEIRLKLAVGAKFQHPGPEMVYLSKAPSTAASYDGSGDWFKIHELGVCDGGDFTSTAWCDYNRDWVAATIPKDTPNGEYLARFEHIGVHRSHVNQPEHYVSCMQIKVTGGGSGTPGPTVKFPGAYKATDAYANFSIYNGRKAFPMPGPKVWSSGSAGGASAGTPAKEEAAPPAAATTLATAVAPAPAAPTAAAPAPATGGAVAKYAQCGGKGFTGATGCASGSTCKAANEWYSQCL